MEIKLPFYARLALVLLALVLIIYLLDLAQSVLIPLAFASMISFLLYPVTRFLEAKGMSRSLSSFVTVLAFIVILGTFIYLLIFQILAFSQDLPLLQVKVDAWLKNMEAWISEKYHIDSSQQIIYINQAANSILVSASMSAGHIFINVTNIIFWIIIMFIFMYFILRHRRLLLNFIIGLFPEESTIKVKHVLLETRSVTNSYMVGLLIEFTLIAIVACTIFSIMGIQYALLLGLMSASLNVIPYLGITISCVLVWFVSMIHHSPQTAFTAAFTLIVLHILDANILLPRIVGRRVKLNALITIVAVLTGGTIWGIAGLFLSIPIAAVIKIIFGHVDTLKPWALLMGIEDDGNGNGNTKK